METALIVSSSPKSIVFFTEMLKAASFLHHEIVETCGEARRLLLERDFDLVIINAPLRDETGENLSRHVAAKGLSQVILVVESAFFEEVSALVEEYGVLTVAKPVNKSLFWTAMKLAIAGGSRLKAKQEADRRLSSKVEDIRIIDRAKTALISYLHMSEIEAHRLIEKQAMDLRTTKRIVAETILKTYEN